MKVCIVCGLKFQPPGGAERVVAEEAARTAAAGHDVTVLTKAIAEEYRSLFADREGVTLREYPGGRHLVHEPPQLVRAIRDIDPDFVFSHYQDEGVYLSTRTLPGSIPFTSHVHGSPLWFTEPDRIVPHRRSAVYDRLVAEVPGHGQFIEDTDLSVKRRVLGELGEYLRGRALRGARFVSTGSERVARELSGLYGVDAQVVRPGVSTEWIDSAGAVDPMPIDDWEETVLSLGRLDERKRVGLLVRAVDTLRNDHDRDVGLVVCGTGPHESALRSTVRELGLGDAVRFEGFVPEASVPRYYRSADAFACPAWMSYGLSPLEAYAIGTRVVVSTDTYAKEVIGGAPGVTTAAPTVDAWANALAEMLTATERPDPSVVPTWQEYVDRKLELVERHALA